MSKYGEILYYQKSKTTLSASLKKHQQNPEQ